MVLESERAAVRHTEIPISGGGFWARWRSRKILESLVDRENPVMIHAHGFEMVSLATKLAGTRHRPFLIDLTEPSPVTTGRRKLLQIAADNGARFRVPSEAMVRHLIDDFKLKTDYLYKISPGVDTMWFEAVRVTPERIRRLSHEWRLPEQSTIAIMATPFAPGYGHKTLLEAVADLKLADIYLVLVGDDKACPGMRADIEKSIAQLGLEGKVVLPETCPDWPAACWLSSLVVACNAVPRGQGPELLAAQAIGRPVIVTNCGANVEMVKSGETAWVVPPENKDALAAAFTEAMSMSPQRRIDLAIHTRDFVSTNFPLELWRDSLFEVYQAMLSQPMLSVGAAA